MKPGGILITEQELVNIDMPTGIRVYGVPATRLAEELGRKMVLNIVMVGFFGAGADSVPPSFQELNLRAFDKGFEYGEQLLLKMSDTTQQVEEMSHSFTPPWPGSSILS